MTKTIPIALLAAVSLAAAAPPAQIAGLWKTPVDDSVVRISPCGAAICGRVVGSSRLRVFPAQKDARNKNRALRTRPIMGLLVLKLNAIGPRKWGGGFVYNPDDGGTYRGTAELTADGSLRLTGCIVAPFCKTQSWTRQ